jgi:peptidoglycan/xylan/chitin deacetylase (PgdA/CDA1 family)
VHWLEQVATALDEAPTPVSFFFRDDDAGWDNDRLLPLLDAFAEHGLPLDLAVIPVELDSGLAAELSARAAATRLCLHQHGFAHVNHERSGRKCEFGPSRRAAEQRRDIDAGRRLLREALGDALDPIFTPPWNRCTEATARSLRLLGFRLLSREWRARPLGVPGLAELPVRIDWVRLDQAARGAALVDAIRGRHAVGIMFHHAVMRAREADDLLGLVAEHQQVRPRSMLYAAGQGFPG